MHELYDAVFVKMWPWYVGGPAIGLYVIILLLAKNRLLSASSTFSFLVDKVVPKATGGFFDDGAYDPEPNWLGFYFVGLFLGGLIAVALSGNWMVSDLPGLSQAYPYPLNIRLLILGLGGLCIGFGTRMSGGCTSGHCIVGVSAGQGPSMFSTAIFFGVGIVVSFAVEYIGKGGF